MSSCGADTHAFHGASHEPAQFYWQSCSFLLFKVYFLNETLFWLFLAHSWAHLCLSATRDSQNKKEFPYGFSTADFTAWNPLESSDSPWFCKSQYLGDKFGRGMQKRNIFSLPCVPCVTLIEIQPCQLEFCRKSQFSLWIRAVFF